MFGRHICDHKKLQSLIDKVEHYSINGYQIFLSSPLTYANELIDAKIMDNIKSYLQDNNHKMVIHGAYLINLAHPFKLIKDGKEIINPFIKKSFHRLKHDMNISVNVGAIGVIIHMPKYLKYTQEIAEKNFIENIQELLKLTDENSVLILENSAHEGTEMYYNLKELGRVYNLLNNNKRIKICLDTCHLFAAGYQLDNENGCLNLFKEIKEYIGWENVICIHLNDSKDDCGKCKDRHDNLGNGKIGFKGLKYIVRKCINKNPDILIVLETPIKNVSDKTIIEELDIVKKWINEPSKKES